MTTPLKHMLLERIKSEGALSLAGFVAESLLHPRYGYYATRDPLTAGDDFITSPQISQMFGELLGIWALETWRQMGQPSSFHLVEPGPGSGIMMADMIRAARLDPLFLKSVRVGLLEASSALKAVQARTLAASPVDLQWYDHIDKIPEGPMIVIANEFLDCLPPRQFIRTDEGWRERLVGARGEELIFTVSMAPLTPGDHALIPPSLKEVPSGSLVEAHPGYITLTDMLAPRFHACPSRALFLDYGPYESEVGDTLQALRAHQKVNPLEAPGEADLTTRVNFSEIRRYGEKAGLHVDGALEQGAFLKRLGLEIRAGVLSAKTPEKRSLIARQIWRLTDPRQMGSLFKALCLSSPDLPPPPGFGAGP